MSRSDEPAELEADRVAGEVTAGRAPVVREAPGATVALKELPAPAGLGISDFLERFPEASDLPDALIGLELMAEAISDAMERLGGPSQFVAQLGSSRTGAWLLDTARFMRSRDQFEPTRVARWIAAASPWVRADVFVLLDAITRKGGAGDEVREARSLQPSLLAGLEKLNRTRFVRAQAEADAQATAAAAAQRRAGPTPEEREDRLAARAETVRRIVERYPADPGTTDARLGSLELADQLVRIQRLDDAAVVETLTWLQGHEPDLFQRALFLGYTVERLGENYHVAGLEPFEGLAEDTAMEIAADVFLGDFSDDPSMTAIAIRTALTLVPGLDTLGDVQDLIANLKALVWDGKYRDFGPWFGFGLTAVGFVPEVGSAVKGILKVGAKGLDLIPPELVRAVVGESARWADEAAGMLWDFVQRSPEWVPATIETAQRLLSALRETLASARSVVGDALTGLLASLDAARAVADDSLRAALGTIVRQAQDLAEKLVPAGVKGGVRSMREAVAGAGRRVERLFTDPEILARIEDLERQEAELLARHQAELEKATLRAGPDEAAQLAGDAERVEARADEIAAKVQTRIAPTPVAERAAPARTEPPRVPETAGPAPEGPRPSEATVANRPAPAAKAGGEGTPGLEPIPEPQAAGRPAPAPEPGEAVSTVARVQVSTHPAPRTPSSELAEKRFGKDAVNQTPDGYHWWTGPDGEPQLVRNEIAPGDGSLRPELQWTNEPPAGWVEVPSEVVRAGRVKLPTWDIPAEQREAFEKLLAQRRAGIVARDQAEQAAVAEASRLLGVPVDDPSKVLDAAARLEPPLSAEEQAGLERLVEDWKAQHTAVGRTSHEVGERAAAGYVAEMYPNATPVFGVPRPGEDWPAPESGVFDQVWREPGPPPKFILVEAKGGSGGLGTKKIGGRAHEQGTKEYRDAIAEMMAKRPDFE